MLFQLLDSACPMGVTRRYYRGKQRQRVHPWLPFSSLSFQSSQSYWSVQKFQPLPFAILTGLSRLPPVLFPALGLAALFSVSQTDRQLLPAPRRFQKARSGDQAAHRQELFH